MVHAAFILGILLGAALWEAISTDNFILPGGEWKLVREDRWDKMVKQAFAWKRELDMLRTEINNQAQNDNDHENAC
ncbi:MAG TPA: hypothetical protein VKP65_20105 [Rhodothermales bacterium]|nr:hypothetical protein [Rhodothermales bacterium]